jgi:hypothetical protein
VQEQDRRPGSPLGHVQLNPIYPKLPVNELALHAETKAGVGRP